MPANASGPGRKAAVLGQPIAHSKSPQLHLAAYRALGLLDWTYERIECSADELPFLVDAFGPEWVGLSVTMPGKFAALRCATERTQRAELVGSANTLVRTATGWRADNTDIDGVKGALGGALTGTAVLFGAGGTAPAVLVALVELGISHVTVAARDPARADRLLDLAGTLGVSAEYCPLGDGSLTAHLARAAVVVSTIPADAAADFATVVSAAPVLLDVIYHPWPTPLAAAVASAGGQVISGLQMLLHQAFAQVEQFTGRPAPRSEMTAALN